MLTELAQVNPVRPMVWLFFFITTVGIVVMLYASLQSTLWFVDALLIVGGIILLISGGMGAYKRFSRRLLSSVTKWISGVVEGHLSHALLFLSVIALLVVSALNFSYAAGMAIALGFTVFSFAFIRLRGRPLGTR